MSGSVRNLPFVLFLAACASSGKIELTREVDGAWVHTFPSDLATTYHAAIDALTGEGWTVVRADPIGGSFSAKSPVEHGVVNVWYRVALIIIEPGAQGSRVRLGLLKTREYAGGGREPTNDSQVSDRDDYEAIFLAIQRKLKA